MSQIREVKEATDIVELIGSRVDLQRSGTYYKGLCPFHNEKTPSFFVSEQMQRYKCFGCGETGDVFTFLEKYEGMSFYEALKELADKAGITLKEVTRTGKDELRDRLLEVLDLAKEYYHFLLTKHDKGQTAHDYLKNRGVSNESIKLFQIGYALDNWDGLITYLHKKKKYPLQLLVQAGLVVKNRQGRFYDRFRNRVVFPLTNRRGQVVGFSGRLLDKDAKEAKYINSPETELYHKSELLYGYSQLYQHIREARRVVVVEGEFDVISSQQAHVNNVVAIKGSALTEEHAKLLSRTVDTVILSLDTDNAGVEATRKAIKVLKDTDLELRVVPVPSGKDPDELIRDNPKAWREAVKQSVTAPGFLISVALSRYDPKTPEGKRSVMKEMLPVLADITHAVEMEHYIRELSVALNVKSEAIRDDLTAYKKKSRLGLKTKVADRNEDSDQTQVAPTKSRWMIVKTRRQALEEYLLFLLLQMKPKTLHEKAKQLQEVELSLPGAIQLIRAMVERGPDITLEEMSRELPEDLQELLFHLLTHEKYFAATSSTDYEKEWQQTLREIMVENTREKIVEITNELSALDKKLNKTPEEKDRQNHLLKKIVELNRAVR